MRTVLQFITSFFARSTNAPAACGLLERAAVARGLSQGDAAQLRINAMALLSVVR